MDHAIYSGLWWLPENEERKLTGTLETRPSALAELRLIGSFKELADTFADVDYPQIFGFTDRGKSITIANAMEKSSNFSAPGFTTQTIAAPLVLVGGHVDYRSVVISEAFLEFTYLAEWIWARGMAERALEPRGYEVAVTDPPLPSVVIGGITLALATGWQVTGNRVHERGLSVSRAVRLQFPEGSSFEALVREWLQPFQEFLSIAVGRPCVITKLSFRTSDGPSTAPGDLIQAIYQVVEPPEPPRRSSPMPHEMLFALSDVEEQFPDLLIGWFSNSEVLRETIDLYFTTQYSSSFVETKFLALSQALEVLHRRTRPNRVRSKREHRTLVDSIAGAVPEEVRGWLVTKLAHSNEPSLVERLTALFGPLESVLTPISPDPQLARLTANTRHYYTHFDEDMAPKAAQGEALFRLNQVLAIAVQASILLQCGFSIERIAALMDAFPPYQDLVTRRRAGDTPDRGTEAAPV
ncbi:MAG: hypothetical protein HYX57_02810 [Chloroflexi bacterium]|nr:hypothetical protein [Chloroflexota bacterium]